MPELTLPAEGIVLAHFIVSDDVERSRRFYTEVLGGRLAYSGPGGLTYVALANSWIAVYAEWSARGSVPDAAENSTSTRSAATSAIPTAI